MCSAKLRQSSWKIYSRITTRASPRISHQRFPSVRHESSLSKDLSRLIPSSARQPSDRDLLPPGSYTPDLSLAAPGTPVPEYTSSTASSTNIVRRVGDSDEMSPKNKQIRQMSPRLEKELRRLERGHLKHMVQGRVPDLLPEDLHEEWEDFVATNAKAPEKPDDYFGNDFPRVPRNIMALYLKPLRKEASYGVPVCDLQIRSYSTQNLMLFADFAMRAAYYCNLPAFGPVPLPKMIERWTVPRAQFIHKKAQENFERITKRRLIQIKDGHPASVQLWLAFCSKHSYYGIGMKANIWEYAPLEVGKEMEKNLDEEMDDAWARIGKDPTRKSNLNASNLAETINRENFRRAVGFNAPMTNEK